MLCLQDTLISIHARTPHAPTHTHTHTHPTSDQSVQPCSHPFSTISFGKGMCFFFVHNPQKGVFSKLRTGMDGSFGQEWGSRERYQICMEYDKYSSTVSTPVELYVYKHCYQITTQIMTPELPGHLFEMTAE